MKLKKLCLHNYCQHTDRSLSLDGNIIAVVGHNGSGKSNLLSSLQFAFTGDVPGVTKADLLSWGAQEGYVEVHFEHNGTQCKIHRDIQSSGAIFHYGDEVYRSASAVAAGLKTHLDLDKDLMKQAVFVRQAEVDAILFTDPRVRELAFQKLLGIGDANKIHKVMGEVLGELQLPQNYDEQIAEGRARWAELHTRKQGLDAQLASLQSRRSTMPALSDIKQSQETLSHRLHAIEKVLETQARLAAADAAVTTARAEFNATPRNTDDMQALDAQLEALTRKNVAAAQYASRLGAWTDAGKAIIALGEAPVTLEQVQEAQAESARWSASVNQALGELQLHENLRKALESSKAVSNTCPVCGASIADSKALQVRLADIVQGMKARMENIRAKEHETSSAATTQAYALHTYQKQQSACMAAYEQADRALKTVEKVEADAVAIQSEIETLRLRKAKYLSDSMTYTRLESRVKSSGDQYDREYKLHMDALAYADSLGVKEYSAEAPAKLRAELKTWMDCETVIKQLDVDLAKHEGTVVELGKTMQALDATVSQLEYKRSQQAGYKAAVATLTSVRDWFNWSNGPHALSASVLGSLNEDVNKFLSQFTAPFTVIPSSDVLGFNVVFHDGRTTPVQGPPPASVLSGGQRMQLAVSFRFATYTMFAGKLGLLSLDEPTSYLDDENVGRFGDLLQRIKKVAQGMNLQVFLATHEQSVLPFCDTAIEL